MNWHEYFTYEPETGSLIWKQRPLAHFKTLNAAGIWNSRYAGKVAGYTRADGYIKVSVFNKLYLAHRIIIEMHDHALLPGEQVDHRDMDRTNNRRSNLRKCSNSQNKMNSRKRVNNTSGFKGVSWDKVHGKWQARIGVNFRSMHIGLYATPQEAHAAYCAAAKEHHGQFARTA